MTPTDELCKMLDEFGVEYTQGMAMNGVLFTVVTRDEHYFILVRDNGAGIEMWSRDLTPEQAIAAMLGSCNCSNNCTNSERTRTCHLEDIELDCDTASEYMLDREWCFDAVYRCSCGYRFGHVAHNRPRYCPNCGAKVVNE